VQYIYINIPLVLFFIFVKYVIIFWPCSAFGAVMLVMHQEWRQTVEIITPAVAHFLVELVSKLNGKVDIY